MRREGALRHELDEKFEAFFVRGRNDGIGALDKLVFVIEAESRVLPGLEGKRAARINANQPQICGQIFALDNVRRKVFVRGQSHARHPQSNRQIAYWVCTKNDRVEQLSALPGAVESMRYPRGMSGFFRRSHP